MLNSNKKNNLESGLNHWLFQKVTAVLLIPVTIWVLLKLPKFIQLSFSDKLSWINSSLNLYLIALFFIISAFHFRLGLTVIIEDYIHNSIVKKYYQLQKLGINNIFIYMGGLFEWLLLQDIYGNDQFPTTTEIIDILKYKGSILETLRDI